MESVFEEYQAYCNQHMHRIIKPCRCMNSAQRDPDVCGYLDNCFHRVSFIFSLIYSLVIVNHILKYYFYYQSYYIYRWVSTFIASVRRLLHLLMWYVAIALAVVLQLGVIVFCSYRQLSVCVVIYNLSFFFVITRSCHSFCGYRQLSPFLQSVSEIILLLWQVGLMRGGRLLAENKPSALTAHYSLPVISL